MMASPTAASDGWPSPRLAALGADVRPPARACFTLAKSLDSPVMFERLRGFLLGGPKNLLDPRIHHSLALVAFFAWVGLGSDGLSSSSYGPQQAYLHLASHQHLALYLVVAMVLTVFLISASYSQIIELFPSGGGGYLVGTKLLGHTPGVISGCALVVDYVLTIAISIASGVEALFSLVPAEWGALRLPCDLLVVFALTGLNLRGVKESVAILTPIFIAFMLTHVGLITYGIFGHAGNLPHLISDTAKDTHQALTNLGLWGVAVIFLRAFALGGGTFTGVEAGTNSTPILPEPPPRTRKRTLPQLALSPPL